MQYKAEFNSIKKGGLLISNFVQKVQTPAFMLASNGCAISGED